MDVVLPLRCGCQGRISAIHLAFSAAGGATQYDERDGTHIYSSVQLARVAAVFAALRRAHATPAMTRSTFIERD
jgi:hypothetical protein